jgi:glycosyltransferase involved in cell wall biosynthesis
MPAVSVIIPAFNAAGTILAAVDSVRRQTFADWELIVVDDGSADDTRGRLRAIDDSRVRIVAGDHVGVARARNTGLRAATGAFVTFLDADDMWMPDKLRAQVDALHQSPEAGASYSWTAFVDEQGRFLAPKEGRRIDGEVYDDLLVTFFLASGSNAMARRQCVEAVGAFDGSIRVVEDWDLWVRVARRWPFAVVPHYHVLYRIGVGSATSHITDYEAGVARVIEREFATAPPWLQRRKGECLANMRQHACTVALTRSTAPGARRRAAALLARSVAHWPRAAFQPRTALLAFSSMLLTLVPRRQVPDAARALLRLYGRWTSRRRPELQDLRRTLEERAAAG